MIQISVIREAFRRQRLGANLSASFLGRVVCVKKGYKWAKPSPSLANKQMSGFLKARFVGFSIIGKFTQGSKAGKTPAKAGRRSAYLKPGRWDATSRSILP